MVYDSNNDGIWDTTFILIGLRHDLSDADHKDFSEIHIHTQNILDNRSSVGFSSQTSMTLTGLTKVLEDISDEVYDD